ncbi:MAG TPA: choice-of-anchor D domain-containing protein [Candidatus Acidoferrum sp.]
MIQIGSGPASALIEFDPTGQTLKFSTFLGGIAPGFASSVAIDANHRVHVSGAAEYGMYTTAGSYAGSIPMPGAGYSSSIYAYVAVVDPTVPGPGLCVAPNTGLTFGAVAPGVTADLKLTITSCGGDPLSLSGASTTSSDFSIPASKNGCIGTLPIGQSCTLDVQFAPSAAGGESSILTIDSNSPIPAELNLSGTGETAPILTLSANSLTFGPQLVGTESAQQTIMLTNTGNAALNGIGFGLMAAYEPIFPLTFTCGPSLSPGASCTFSLAFKPASTGTTATTLTVENNSRLPFQQVSLSGTSPQSPFLVGTQTGGSMTSTVSAGSTATYALKITPAGGYSGAVSLACSSLPANATCAFVPSTLAFSAGTATNFTLSILTQSTQTASLLSVAGLGVTLAGVLFFLPFKRNRDGIAALICFGALLLITGMSACGGGSSSASTPQAAKVAPGTYTINVVASDASANQVRQPITLIVQ